VVVVVVLLITTNCVHEVGSSGNATVIVALYYMLSTWLVSWAYYDLHFVHLHVDLRNCRLYHRNYYNVLSGSMCRRCNGDASNSDTSSKYRF